MFPILTNALNRSDISSLPYNTSTMIPTKVYREQGFSLRCTSVLGAKHLYVLVFCQLPRSNGQFVLVLITVARSKYFLFLMTKTIHYQYVNMSQTSKSQISWSLKGGHKRPDHKVIKVIKVQVKNAIMKYLYL